MEPLSLTPVPYVHVIAYDEVRVLFNQEITYSKISDSEVFDF